MNRDLAFRLIKITRFTILGLVILTFASWAMPMFTYTGLHNKEVQDTISLWGFIGFTKNYPQIQVLLDVKYVNMATINVPLIMLACGVVSLLTVGLKRGIATTVFPLIFSGYGLIGYLSDDFMRLCNHSGSRAIQIILVALTLIATLVAIYANIVEIRTRPADYYLPKLGML